LVTEITVAIIPPLLVNQNIAYFVSLCPVWPLPRSPKHLKLILAWRPAVIVISRGSWVSRGGKFSRGGRGTVLLHTLLIRLVVVFLMLAIILLVVFLLIVFLLVLILLILSSLLLLLLLLLTVVFLIFGSFWLGDVVIFAASARRHWDVHLWGSNVCNRHVNTWGSNVQVDT